MTTIIEYIPRQVPPQVVYRWSLGTFLVGLACGLILIFASCAAKQTTVQQDVQSAQATLTLNAADVTDRSLRIDGHASAIHNAATTAPVIAKAIEPHVVAIHAETVGLRADATAEKAVADVKLADALKQSDAKDVEIAKLTSEANSKGFALIGTEVAAAVLVLAGAGVLMFFGRITLGIAVGVFGTIVIVVGEVILQRSHTISLIGLGVGIVAVIAILIYELSTQKLAAGQFFAAFKMVGSESVTATEEGWQWVVHHVENLFHPATVKVASKLVKTTPPVVPVTKVAA